MSKKDYDAIAAAIKRAIEQTQTPNEKRLIQNMASEIAAYMTTDNAGFNPVHFFKAAGMAK